MARVERERERERKGRKEGDKSKAPRGEDREREQRGTPRELHPRTTNDAEQRRKGKRTMVEGKE